MPKPPGKERERVRLLHEVKLAGEEVIEVNQLRIAVDGFVRALLEGQTDVETETVLAAGAALRRAHDAVAAAGDDHVILRHHQARELLRHLKFRLGRQRAGRSEDAHFSEIAVAGKHFRRVAHLLERTVHELEVRRPHSVARHLQRGHDHLLDQLRRFLRAPICDQLPDPLVPFGTESRLPPRRLIVREAGGKIFHCLVSTAPVHPHEKLCRRAQVDPFAIRSARISGMCRIGSE